MAQMTLTIPDPVAPRILAGFTGEHKYQETIDDGEGNVIPNPESKFNFTKRKIMEYVLACVASFEKNQAGKAARDAAATDLDSLGIDVS